jgi:uncharacterized alpha-E superfamily protein
MLSRVAGRIYWMSRYLERAENTARLVDVYGELLLDLPAQTSLGWAPTFQILGQQSALERVSETLGEDAAVAALLGDEDRPYSLAAALSSARENARTTRDLVPTEAWRTINELYLFAGTRLESEVDRADALKEVLERCHQVCGILDSTMSHDDAYQFVRIGRNLERADMISRMIDVAAAVLMVGRKELVPFEDALWGATLRSLSAYQMYRQHVRRAITGEDVIRFLLHHRSFPRSIVHCTDRMGDALSRPPRGEEVARDLAGFATRVDGLDVGALDRVELHEAMDRFQLELQELHGAVTRTWLDPARFS